VYEDDDMPRLFVVLIGHAHPYAATLIHSPSIWPLPGTFPDSMLCCPQSMPCAFSCLQPHVQQHVPPSPTLHHAPCTSTMHTPLTMHHFTMHPALLHHAPCTMRHAPCTMHHGYSIAMNLYTFVPTTPCRCRHLHYIIKSFNAH
jgi:hypothetical protein